MVRLSALVVFLFAVPALASPEGFRPRLVFHNFSRSAILMTQRHFIEARESMIPAPLSRRFEGFENLPELALKRLFSGVQELNLACLKRNKRKAKFLVEVTFALPGT